VKSLILLLGLVIFVAVLYQTVFTPAIKTPAQKQEVPKNSPALQTLKQAQELKKILNKQTKKSNYEDKLKQH